MMYISDKPPAHIDPRDLTSGQLAALRVVDEYKLNRVPGGWQAPGSPKVLVSTAQFLGLKRLVIRRDYHGRPRLETTANGQYTLAIADQRRRPRT